MATTSSPIEVTTRYATTVPELSDAWAFVMDRVDAVGASPQIHITPIWVIGRNDEEDYRKFEVVVEGMVEEKEKD